MGTVKTVIAIEQINDIKDTLILRSDEGRTAGITNANINEATQARIFMQGNAFITQANDDGTNNTFKEVVPRTELKSDDFISVEGTNNRIIVLTKFMVNGDLHFDDEGVRYDKERTKKIENEGSNVIRFENQDVLWNLEHVLSEIRNNFKQR